MINIGNSNVLCAYIGIWKLPARHESCQSRAWNSSWKPALASSNSRLVNFGRAQGSVQSPEASPDLCILQDARRSSLTWSLASYTVNDPVMSRLAALRMCQPASIFITVCNFADAGRPCAQGLSRDDKVRGRQPRVRRMHCFDNLLRNQRPNAAATSSPASQRCIAVTSTLGASWRELVLANISRSLKGPKQDEHHSMLNMHSSLSFYVTPVVSSLTILTVIVPRAQHEPRKQTAPTWAGVRMCCRHIITESYLTYACKPLKDHFEIQEGWPDLAY